MGKNISELTLGDPFMRQKYNEQFGVDPDDKTSFKTTREALIEKYTRALRFWSGWKYHEFKGQKQLQKEVRIICSSAISDIKTLLMKNGIGLKEVGYEDMENFILNAMFSE